MSRLMSVALTEKAVRERRKTVTRRLGWKFLKPGDRLAWTPSWFVGFYCDSMGCTPTTEVTRIEWIYLDCNTKGEGR